MNLPSTRFYLALLDSLKESAGYISFSDEEKLSFDNELNNIPISDKEAMKYVLDKIGFEKAQKVFEQAKEIVQSKNKADKISEIKQTIIDTLKKDKKEATFELAEYFLSKYKIITLSDTEELYYYKNGVYIQGIDKVISVEIQKILKKEANINLVNEVLAHIKRSTYRSRSEIKESKDKICLNNGILNLKNLNIEPHNAEIIFFNRIPVDYQSEVICSKIMNFLSEIVLPEDIKILQELIGYCVYKCYPVHKAFMLVGSGANGKSSFIKLLKTFLGEENCSSIPLQSFEINRFAMAQLHGKLANLFADLPAKALRDTSFFKMLTGEDLIPAEKKFKDGFTFTNNAKMIFSCNQIPRSPDDSDAFFRRWIIINFPNQFLNEKADKNLIEKLTSKEELSGFLNFAIEGLRRLLQNGDFTKSKSITEIREEYIRQSDSVGAFIMDNISITPESYVVKKQIYTEYCDYARKKKYITVSENTFHQQLQQKIRIEDYRPTINGKREQCWKGIKMGKNLDNPDSFDYRVSPVNDVNPFSNLSNTYFGLCSYCKNESNITNKDINGNHLCSNCVKEEKSMLTPPPILNSQEVY